MPSRSRVTAALDCHRSRNGESVMVLSPLNNGTQRAVRAQTLPSFPQPALAEPTAGVSWLGGRGGSTGSQQQGAGARRHQTPCAGQSLRKIAPLCEHPQGQMEGADGSCKTQLVPSPEWGAQHEREGRVPCACLLRGCPCASSLQDSSWQGCSFPGEPLGAPVRAGERVEGDK